MDDAYDLIVIGAGPAGYAAAGGFGLLAPAFQSGLDVAGEDLRRIVVAVELVLFVDAG